MASISENIDIDQPLASNQVSIDDKPPSLDRRDSLLEEVLEEVEEKIASVWQTLRNKPNEEDLNYAHEESSKLYNNQPLATRSEILTWYLYDWANSPMFNVIMGLIMPLYLTALATHYGCDHESEYGCDYNNNLIGTDDPLIAYIGGWGVSPASFTFTIISISGALQAVAYIGIGALADYSYYQFYLFRICTLIASLMILVFLFLDDPATYLFAGWWTAFQLVFFGLALIFYNAYLPPIVENHWIVRRAIRTSKDTADVVKLKQRITDDMSQYGYALGYFGSLVMTLIGVTVLAIMNETQYEQFSNFGLISSNSESFDEQWLKKVYKIEMSFSTNNLHKIQLFYNYRDDLTIDGGIYGDSTLLTTDSFEISNNNYITAIEYWYNDDNSINSMRFTTQNDEISSIYGDDTIISSPDEIMIGSNNNYIFSGYLLYIDNGIITGMDTIMLNLSTGQFPSTLPLRIIIFLVFLWWNGFQLLTFKYFKRRDGPPLPIGNNAATFSIKQFYYAVSEAKLYPNMFRYLCAWFMFSDGLNTMSTAAILFATIEIGFTAAEAAILLLEVLLFGAAGGVLFLYIQRKIKWNAKQMVLLHLSFFICMSAYSVVGLIPGSPIGLKSKTEMYLFGVLYGLNFGSVQSYARSVFAYIVPVGKEAQMFALYEITDKGSSWIGPLMVGFIANTLSIRWGMFYVIIFFILPIPLILRGVSLKNGIKQAGRWNEIKNEYQLENQIDINNVSPLNQIQSASDNDNEQLPKNKTTLNKTKSPTLEEIEAQISGNNGNNNNTIDDDNNFEE